MPATWTDSAKFKLLLAVIDSMNVEKPPEWDVVAAKMGNEFTKEAVRQQFQKIRRNVKTELGEDGDADITTPKKTAPRSTKATPSSNKASAQKRGHGKAQSANEDEDDDFDVNESPSKKPKVRASATPKSKRAAKAEAPETDMKTEVEMEEEENLKVESEAEV